MEIHGSLMMAQGWKERKLQVFIILLFSLGMNLFLSAWGTSDRGQAAIGMTKSREERRRGCEGGWRFPEG